MIHDYHEEAGPPTGYAFNSEDATNEDSSGTNDDLLAVSVMLILIFLVVIIRLRRGDE